MKILKNLFSITILLAVILVSLGNPGSTVKADTNYTCLPSCNIRDARFLSLAGTGLSTFAGDSIHIEIAVPGAMTSFELGIFDGNTAGYWDEGSTPALYTLFADPMGDGTGSYQIAEWLGSSMPDNAWFTVNIPTNAQAQSPSGNYFYYLHITNTAPGTTSQNSFKIRTSALVEMHPNAFAFVASLTSLLDMKILYPNFPNFLNTPYDGTWDLYIYVPESTSAFTIWDGDLDYGTPDCTMNDTNDLDTEDAPWRPDWAAGTEAVSEGVATTTTHCTDARGVVTTGPNGEVYRTGAPAEQTVHNWYGRAPGITYQVETPDGFVYFNENPSGNQEWEQFRIDTDPISPVESMDYYHDGLLPAGMYLIHMDGVDLHNLNAWRLSHDWVGVCEDGTPCVPIPQPFLVGDTVWYDINNNGIQEIWEPGLAGVKVNLLDVNGVLIASTITDDMGMYSFGVGTGIFTVQVDPANSTDGGVLYGFSTTAGGDGITAAVIDDNVLTYDFGYWKPGTVGDLVWMDSSADGQFQPEIGEVGLAGVQVTITYDLDGDGGFDYSAVTTTDASGLYLFENTPAGSFQIIVGGLPVEMNATYDFDGIDTLDTAAGSIEGGQTDLNYDFGYVPAFALGTGTPGYWKNHPTAWPVTQITIGGRTYTVAEAIKWMNKSTSTDKTIGLFSALVSAKLNVGIGNNCGCISEEILAADAWLAAHPVGSRVKANSAFWKAIESTFIALDDYNNGLLCVPHRD